MPHIIIEFSAGQANDEGIERMLDSVHQAAVNSGLFDESHIRVRAMPLQYYRVAGSREPFIHAQLRIHTGRSDEQKSVLSRAVLESLKAQQWEAISITVEVVELHKPSYAKSQA